MVVLFCSDPLGGREPDPGFAAEADAAGAAGFETALVDFEALVHQRDPVRAARRVPESLAGRTALYRGWMLTPDRYAALYTVLAGRGVRLINDPAAYRHAHYLPESYPVIEPHTPRSVWIETGGDVAIDRVMELLRPFGAAAVMVKDFVKSQKHYWDEACYIPSAADRAAVERVVRRFLQLQGEELNEGLVFREFVPFEPLGTHPRSGMPLGREFRFFFLDGEPFFWTEYWEEGDYGSIALPVERFRAIGARVRSRFFTMDVARTAGGEWLVVELGDAQVASLPERADPEAFYRALRERWPER